MKATVARRLNEKGIAKLREMLRLLRAGTSMPHVPAIAFDDTLTEKLRADVLVEPRKLATKFDAALYLRDALRSVDRLGLADDGGLWSWLTVFYLDQVLPASEDGRRKAKADYYYVPDPRYPYRHLLAGPFRIVQQHGEAARLLLRTPLHRYGTLLYQVTWRQELLRNRALLELVDRLYMNPRSGRPKRGAVTETRDGSVQRLFAVLSQLELTYDLHGMSADQILALLPGEFDAWRR